MEKTTVYLDSDDYRRLKRVAGRRRVPPAQLLREAVAEYVVKHDRKRAPQSVGAFSSRRGDLAENAEQLLKRGFGRSK